MAKNMNSFHIFDMVYDAQTQELKYELEVDGEQIERVGLGLMTDDDIVEDLRLVLNKFYVRES